MTNSNGNRTIKNLVCIDRKQGAEQLRVDLDEFLDEKGENHRYVSVRRWFWAQSGDMLPTKSGVTIRRNELQGFTNALREAQQYLDTQHGDETQPPARVEQQTRGDARDLDKVS